MLEGFTPTLKAPNRTKPIGRLLRFVVGGLLLALVFPYYRAENWVSIVITLGVALGLVALYLLIHLFIWNYLPSLNQYLGALLAWVPGLLLFVLGGVHGQVAVVTYVGVSLLLASARADPGCEVMSIPNLIFEMPAHLACLVFSPVDWLEAKMDKHFHGAA